VLRFRFRLLCEKTRTSEESTAPDVTRVTESGGDKRKVATKDRRGVATERYDVWWRVQLRAGVGRLVGRATDGVVRAAAVPISDVPCCSANGRKAAVLTLRSTARMLKSNDPRVPIAAHAYLDLVAFWGAVELATVDELAEKYEYRQSMFSGVDLLAGRKFVERWSLPLADLGRDHVRRLIAELGHGRAAATEGRQWTQLRAVLRWWQTEGITTATSRHASASSAARAPNPGRR